jgi:YbbR domain-containing protein
MARRSSGFHPGLAFLALGLSVALWGMAHGSSTIERGFDVPVVFQGLPDDLVMTEQGADVINIRVLGSRAALRNLSPASLEYEVAVDGSKPGAAVYEVDTTKIELPRGARIVSRSPHSLEVTFELKARRLVEVRPDVSGEPAEGFQLGEISVSPPRVWLAGARSSVLRLSQVVTEPIDVSGFAEPLEREARLALGGGHVWMEKNEPVVVSIQIGPRPAEERGAPAQRRRGR